MARIRGCDIVVRLGDITDEPTQAIVNAANSTLLGGGGVDGAIHAKAGPELLEECREIRRTIWPAGLPTGQAVFTRGGRLAARFVIHTVGPVWRGGRAGEAQDLRNAYTRCLELAESHGLASVSFPSISTGAYGYPRREAARVAIHAVLDWLAPAGSSKTHAPARHLREVRFVLFSKEAFAEFEAVLNEILGSHQDRDPSPSP